MSRYDDAISSIDDANAADPNVESHEGRDWPKELLYGRRMSGWVERLAPDASEPLRLAARAQHIERWHIPRADYEPGKKGYHLWRTTLYRYHAQRAGEILKAAGYDAETIERVASLLQKKHMRSDPEAQIIEDAACLVFLEHHFAEFAQRYDEPKIADIVRKTWAKMSPNGHKAALALLERLPDGARRLIQSALA